MKQKKGLKKFLRGISTNLLKEMLEYLDNSAVIVAEELERRGR